MVEDLAHRRELGACQRERRVVDDVHDVDPARPEHAIDVSDELPGREVPRHGRSGERVPDHEVVSVGRLGGKAHAAIADDDLERVARDQPELLASSLEHDRVDLETREYEPGRVASM